jgi:hypothetical protein
MKISVFILMAVLPVIVSAAPPKLVKASSFGFNASDATECLQKAIDSGAKTVIVDQTGHEWCIRPIKLRSNLELVLGKNVIIRAKDGEFKNLYIPMFKGENIENITVRGNPGSVICMNKSDYQNPKKYDFSEWRHAFSFYGVNNIVIRDLTIARTGGDAIYLGGSRKQSMCKNVQLLNLKLHDNHRQGISVIGAENLLIKNCRITDTKGAPPMAGIDLEPNYAANGLINCRVEDCVITGNHGGGILIHYVALNETSRPLSVSIKNCRIENNRGGISIEGTHGKLGPAKGKINIENCSILNKKWYSLRFRNFEENGVVAKFRNVTVDNSGNRSAPIAFMSERYNDFTGIDFGNLVVTESVKRPVVEVMGLGAAGIVKLAGKPTVRIKNGVPRQINLRALERAYRPNPALKNFRSATVDLKTLKSASSKGKTTASLKLRGLNTFVQYLPPNGKIDVKFSAEEIRGAPNVPVTVRDQTGITVAQFRIPPSGYTYKLRGKPGVYSFTFFAPAAAVIVKSDAPGQGFVAAADRLKMFRCNGVFYFNVPAKLTEVKLEVYADEPVSAKLCNSIGKVCDSVKYLRGGIKVLYAKRKTSGKDEVWKLEVKAIEDYGFRLGAPLTPVVATAPENLLIGSTGLLAFEPNKHSGKFYSQKNKLIIPKQKMPATNNLLGILSSDSGNLLGKFYNQNKKLVIPTKDSLQISNPNAIKNCGVAFRVNLNQKKAVPIFFSGESKAKNVSGKKDGNYSIYADVFFADGTKKYGVFESFNVGTHDWEKVTRVFKPIKPISYVRFNVLFRYHKGKIEVRNLLFKELD